MHGARGGAPEGKRNGNYRHGGRTKEMIEVWKLIKSFLWLMSAFGRRADIAQTTRNVCFWPEADIISPNFRDAQCGHHGRVRPSLEGQPVRRRDFITLVGGVTAGWPLAARAQQPERLVRIGYLAIAPAAQGQSDDTAFREGLRDFGYVEGKNLQIEYRTAAGDESRVPVLAKEL
jgi:hypothetical protein